MKWINWAVFFFILYILFSQPTLLQALHMAVVLEKGSEVSKVLQGPLNYLDQSLSKQNTAYLTGVRVQHLYYSVKSLGSSLWMLSSA